MATRGFFFVAVLFTLLCASTKASAQLHWDVAAQGGASKRFLTNTLPGTPQPSFGPMVGLAGHVAIVPLVRVGAYAAFESSAVGKVPARNFYTAGIRGKLNSPWVTDTLHGWFFAGAGYSGVYGNSYSASLAVAPAGPLSAPTTTAFDVPGAGGGLVEVPFGVGLGVRLRRPWELVFELGGRAGFAFTGPLYRGREAHEPINGVQQLSPLGNDTVSIFLTAGVGLDL